MPTIKRYKKVRDAYTVHTVLTNADSGVLELATLDEWTYITVPDGVVLPENQPVVVEDVAVSGSLAQRLYDESWHGLLLRERVKRGLYMDETLHIVPGDEAKCETFRRSSVEGWGLPVDQISEDVYAGMVAQYEPYEVGKQYEAGDEFSFEGDVYVVVQAHASQADWRPDVVRSLYVKTVPKGVVPEWRQPTGAHDAYQKGDRVLYKGKIYESQINANVWSPEAYPPGWKLVG